MNTEQDKLAGARANAQGWFETIEDLMQRLETAQEQAECGSTCGAYRDHEGNWRPGHLRIEWHKRQDHFRDPAPPCDVGMFGDQAKQPDLF